MPKHRLIGAIESSHHYLGLRFDRMSFAADCLSQGTQPTPQQARVTRQMFVDQRADLAAIHVNREIAVLSELKGRPRVLVRKPADPTCGTDRSVGGADVDAFSFRKQLLGRLPYGFEGIDQSEDCTVTLDQRPRGLDGYLIQRNKRRLCLGEASF